MLTKLFENRVNATIDKMEAKGYAIDINEINNIHGKYELSVYYNGYVLDVHCNSINSYTIRKACRKLRKGN